MDCQPCKANTPFDPRGGLTPACLVHRRHCFSAIPPSNWFPLVASVVGSRPPSLNADCLVPGSGLLCVLLLTHAHVDVIPSHSQHPCTCLPVKSCLLDHTSVCISVYLWFLRPPRTWLHLCAHGASLAPNDTPCNVNEDQKGLKR